ncbi:hypothetical protein ACJIZ3_007910 [Penstemon smallii]|uniref:Uncharacterized protein n=1 Tax=Penstemon smallii TaxID=265156 RepID=A0ABD3T8A3_9LAMI
MDNPPPPPRDQNHPPMDNPPLDQIHPPMDNPPSDQIHPPPCDPNINEIHEIIDLNDDLMREILADSLDANHEITSREHQLSGPSDTFFPNINPYVASTSHDPTPLQFPNINPVVPHGRSDAFIPTVSAAVNLPSSLDMGHIFNFQVLGIYDKNNIKAMELKYLDLDDVRANFQPPGCSWAVIRIKIRRNTSFDELIGSLNKKLDTVPQNMKIFYEDTFGIFGRIMEEEDMTECLRIFRGQKILNLVIF